MEGSNNANRNFRLLISEQMASFSEAQMNQLQDLLGTVLDTLGAKLDDQGAKLDALRAQQDTQGAKLDDLRAEQDTQGAKLDDQGATLAAQGQTLARVDKAVGMLVEERCRFVVGLMPQGYLFFNQSPIVPPTTGPQEVRSGIARDQLCQRVHLCEPG